MGVKASRKPESRVKSGTGVCEKNGKSNLPQRTRLVRHSWAKGVSDGGRDAEENL